MKKYQIIYFHGFASAPGSSKSVELQKRFAVFSPDVPYSLNYIDELTTSVANFLKTLPVGTKTIFTGTSLGGYFATYLGDMFDAKVLAINPSVNPYKDLQKFVGMNKNYQTNIDFELTQADVDSFKFRDLKSIISDQKFIKAIICSKDPVVDALTAMDFYENKEIIDSDDHQFRDLNKMTETLIMMFNENFDNFANLEF